MYLRHFKKTELNQEVERYKRDEWDILHKALHTSEIYPELNGNNQFCALSTKRKIKTTNL